MPTSVKMEDRWWDVVVSRKSPGVMTPVWLAHYDWETRKTTQRLLCQVCSTRTGWAVVVDGPVCGLRLVWGFKSRWKAIQYAIEVRTDINVEAKADR